MKSGLILSRYLSLLKILSLIVIWVWVSSMQRRACGVLL